MIVGLLSSSSLSHHNSKGSVKKLHDRWLVVILLLVFEGGEVQRFQKVGKSVTSNTICCSASFLALLTYSSGSASCSLIPLYTKSLEISKDSLAHETTSKFWETSSETG